VKRPAQKPGKSRQDYGTPPEFLRAVERKFGQIVVDLAAHERNHVAPDYYGPHTNSLVQDWTKHEGVLWLNPPFGKPEPWAAKCSRSKGPGTAIPTSRGWAHVQRTSQYPPHGQARRTHAVARAARYAPRWDGSRSVHGKRDDGRCCGARRIQLRGLRA